MDIVILLLLVLLNGLFAMSEIAVISSRNTRLQKLASEGNPGARSALQLKNEPSTFLSTVQVGITMVGILSGAIGETALVDPLAAWLKDFSPIAPYARGVAITAVVMGLTYFSVVCWRISSQTDGTPGPGKDRCNHRPAHEASCLYSKTTGLVFVIILKHIVSSSQQKSEARAAHYQLGNKTFNGAGY